MSDAPVPPAPPPRRKPRPDKSELPVSFLPEGNRPAKYAYVAALVGLVPGVGLVCGPVALVLGQVGRRRARADEQKRGVGHAALSVMLGGLEAVCNALGLYFVGLGRDWW